MYKRSTISLVLTLATLVMGTVVLVGWWTRDDGLRSILPGEPGMKANTAISLVLCSVVLLLNYFSGRSLAKRLISKGLCGVVVLIGFFTIIEYVFTVDLRIDELLFHDELPTTLVHLAGRMSPVSAVNFVLI